jgi:hypothetical protein
VRQILGGKAQPNAAKCDPWEHLALAGAKSRAAFDGEAMRDVPSGLPSFTFCEIEKSRIIFFKRT